MELFPYHLNLLRCNNNEYHLIDEDRHILSKKSWNGIKKVLNEFYSKVNDKEIDDYNKRVDDEKEKYDKFHGERVDAEKLERRKGYVYFIKSGNAVKIGMAKDPEKRVYSMQSHSPNSLEVVHKIKSDDCILCEKFFQDMFEKLKIRGEWFELSDYDIQMIAKNFGTEFNKEDIKEW